MDFDIEDDDGPADAMGRMHSEPLLLGPPLRPSAGYLPISDALYWIASQGGARSFNARDRGQWEPAIQEFMARISDGTVEITGRQSLFSLAERIDGFKLIGVPLCIYVCDGSKSIEMIMARRPYIDIISIPSGSVSSQDKGDRLCNWDCQSREMIDVRAKAADVIKIWAYQEPALISQAELVPPATSAERTARVRWLADKLRNDSNYRRAWAAREWGISPTGSAMRSIWQDARRGAELPERGTSGAPSKRDRESRQNLARKPSSPI